MKYIAVNHEPNLFWCLDFPYCRYLVHANGICAGYSLFSAVIVAVPRPSTMPKAWAFFLLDQVNI